MTKGRVSHKKRVAIVGAGPGGLTAGMILARRGYDVTIYEKADRVGGRNAELRDGDYRHDTGPTFLHQRFTLDGVFAEAGRKVDEELGMILLDPMTRLSWEDGTELDTTSNPEEMLRRIAQVFPGEEAGYKAFMDDHEQKFKDVYPCLTHPYMDIGKYFSREMWKVMPHVLTPRSLVGELGRYFKDPRLLLAFTFQAKYLGMSPWKCPALFSIISYSEHRYGIWHVEGGLCQISDAMGRIFLEEGGVLRCNTPVRRVLFSSKGTACGVELEDGSREEADAVVINADYAHAMSTIMGDQGIAREKLEKLKYSCSTYMLYLGVDRQYAEQPHHQIIFAGDYRKNVGKISANEFDGDDFSVYVRNASINDPTLAPAGHSSMYVLVPTVNTKNSMDWEKTSEEFGEKVLERIEQKSRMKDLRKHIVSRQVITPKHWEDSGVFLGATFNLAHTLDQMLYMRPHNRLNGYSNVYLVGGGTHPGSGLPTIYESGRISADLVCSQFGEQIARKAVLTPN